MSHTDAILGSPPSSWSTLKADLIRLRRTWDFDDETAQSRSFVSNQLASARIQLLDKILAHIEPAVEAELNFYDLVDEQAKASLHGPAVPALQWP